MLYYASSVRETLHELGTSEHGLPTSEIKERRQRYGTNSIKVSGHPWWQTLATPFKSLFMVVLFVAAIISLFNGVILDAGMIFIIMAISAAIYYIQHFTTERILRTLRKHEQQYVSVRRDNAVAQVEATQIVVGDIIIVSEGEKIPADSRIINEHSLSVNESQLTGESLPITKQTDALAEGKDIYDQTNMLFEGSFVISGDGVAVVTAVGNDTEFGQIAHLTSSVDAVSPIQKKVDQLISWLISVVIAIAIVSFMLARIRGMDIVDSLELVIALSVSAIPESLPVAISVILVFGMRRMATKKALVRTMRSIETIGATTAIATDKTGTLTKNELHVAELWHPQNSHSHTRTAMLNAINRRETSYLDPLDEALVDYLRHNHMDLSTQQPLLSLPFDMHTAMSGNLWHNGADYSLYVKGAPEQILLHCDLTENEHEQAIAKLHSFAGSGYRVIALAHTTLRKPISSLEDLPKRHRLTFAGFVTVSDTIRPEAKSAIRTATKAGIAVYMVTGDHYETAFHVGRELGIVTTRDQVLDSRHIITMSDADLLQSIDTVRIFSRVTPEAKYRILELLKQRHITAMTGDGVNDVPALSDAHVGIAMGNGAKIAKDASDIILVDNNFRTILNAIHEGRTILTNIRRMLIYLLATNTGEVLTTVGALLLAIPIPLFPIQILWINLVTDSLLVIPLGLEPSEHNSMRRRPRKMDAPLLNGHQVIQIILVALTMAMLTITIYLFYASHYSISYARTIAFSSLVVMQWASALALRHDETTNKHFRIYNKPFYASLAAAITLQIVALFGPLGSALHVVRVAPIDIAITSLIAFCIPFTLIELHRHTSLHYTRHKRHQALQTDKSAV